MAHDMNYESLAVGTRDGDVIICIELNVGESCVILSHVGLT